MSGHDDTVDAAGHTIPASGPTAHLEQRDPAEGPRQIGRYRILRVIGRGGMGTVYAAHDPELGRDVAVKSLHELARGDAAMADRLRREAQALARVVHPNVVSVYDAGVDGGTPFLVMQLVDGVTLDEHLRTRTPSLDEILALFAQAGRGLVAIHDAKLVHRDVKPANMLVDRDGVVRVSDLGLARIGAMAPAEPSQDGTGLAVGSDVTSGTITRGVAGTPAYMAPEQFADGEVGPAADQFAFCIALWEALFGARPFLGATTGELLDGIRAGRIREPARDRRVPVAILRAVRRGLSPDAGDRFASMRDLLAALQPRSRAPWIVGGVAVVAAGAGLFAMARGGDDGHAREPAAPPPPPPAKPTAFFKTSAAKRVTFNDACEEFPSYSPDGKTVYFDGQVGADYHLFSADTATWTPRELTQTKGWDFAASVSPDGRMIAFVRNNADGMSTYVADVLPDGSLSTPRHFSKGPGRPSWSPDGKRLWGGDRTALISRDVATGAEVRKVVPPDADVPLLGFELRDGRFVMLGASAAGTGLADSIYLYPADGGAPKKIFGGPSMEEVLALAPEGDAVFASPLNMSGAPEMIRVPFDGTEEMQMGSGGVSARKQLALSSAGEAVWSDCSEQTSLSLVVSEGGAAPRLVDLPRANWSDAYPQGIPGTTRMVFQSDRSEGVRIWEIDRAKQGPARRIPLGDLEPVRIAVSLDGTMVAGAEGDSGLWVGPVDGSAPPRNLVPDPGDLAPQFSRDGTRIFFERQDGEHLRIASVPVAGGEVTWAVDGWSVVPAPSPTADVLAYLQPVADDVAVMLLDLRTHKTRRLKVDLPPTPWNGLAWSPDGKRLALLRNDGYLAEVDASTGKPRRTLDSGADMLAGVTCVGDEIIVGRTRWAGDLWTTSVISPPVRP